MRSYKETTDRIFEKSERIIQKKRKRKKAAAGIFGFLFSGAVLLTLAGTLSRNPSNHELSSSETLSAGETPDAGYDSQVKYGTLELFEEGIFFNDQIRPIDLGTPEMSPEADEEILIKTPEELQEYYGTDIYPTVLPESFSKEMIADPAGSGHFSVYQREGWGVYYDVNTFIYTDEKAALEADTQDFPDHNTPAVKIMVMKYTSLSGSDYMSCLQSPADLMISAINGQYLQLYRYEDVYGLHYTAYFWIEDVCFHIFGDLITEEEFIALLEGYLTDQQTGADEQMDRSEAAESCIVETAAEETTAIAAEMESGYGLVSSSEDEYESPVSAGEPGETVWIDENTYYVVPEDPFNPLTASPEELKKRGYPERPDDPEELAEWWRLYVHVPIWVEPRVYTEADGPATGLMEPYQGN